MVQTSLKLLGQILKQYAYLDLTNRLIEPSSGQRFQPYLYHLDLWMHYTGHIDDVSSRS